MTPHKIKIIASSALNNIEAVLRHWLPDGKREGREYLPLNPKRADGSPGSFSINMHSGSWSDFATGDKGGDLVALVAYLENIPQGDAASRLAEFLGISLEKSDAKKHAASDLKGQSNTKTLPDSNNAINGSPEKNIGWQCVMPVPDDAPKSPAAHSRHGKPSQRYPYCDLNGRVNFYHDRYEPRQPEERKQFSPLTLWQKGKIFKWQFKAPPEPRPLYGLPGLLKYPNATVWLVEGEKAVIALEKLLPDHPVLTWQGGSQAVSKSDYTPLTGRHVVVWPDHDAAGTKAATVLVKQLRASKVASINVLDVSRLARKDDMPLQPGDDAHDLLVAGWTAEQFTAFLTQDGSMMSADAIAGKHQKHGKQAATTIEASDGVETIERFQLFDNGLYVNEQQNDGTYRRLWLCSPIKPLAMVRTEQGREWGLLIWLVDPDDKEKKIVLSMRSFNGDALAASGELLDAGLRIANGKGRKGVIEYLQSSTPERRARTTNKTGWHGLDDEMVYVLPDGVMGESNEEWLYANQLPDANPYRQKGTLKQWQDNVAAFCTGNSRLVFSLSTAFASPLLHLLAAESGGFQFTGNSSIGKSTALFVASSVCGGRDYLQRWRSTDNGLESLAQSRSDALLVLDEVKQLDGKIAAEAAYMLANSCGKVRANANGGARSQATWRVLFLSSGELSLSQHVTDSGKRVNAGMEVRLCDLPADAGAGMGLFENIHGYESPSKFAETLTLNAGQYYGTAFVAFIRKVLENRKDITPMLQECEEAFKNHVLTEKASGQARRVAGRFALVAAAGELAGRWGIAVWQPSESLKAAIACFTAWLDGYGGEGNKEKREILERIREFLQRNHEGRFTNINRTTDKDHAPKTIDRAGFRETVNEETHYYIFPEVFKNQLCGQLNATSVLKMLIEMRYAKRGDGKNLKPQITLPDEGKKRMVHILPSIFDETS